MDRKNSRPWWIRWNEKYHQGWIHQCSCHGCPVTASEGKDKLAKTVEEDLWENGQMALVDMARRTNLKYGPNRAMQELIVERNDKIMDLLRSGESLGPEMSRKIQTIQLEYINKISYWQRFENFGICWCHARGDSN
jgi:hypothetical protein